MAYDNEKTQQHQQQHGTDSTEDSGNDRVEQFNELSELSLEERMNVADQIGIPVATVDEALATGAMRGGDDVADGPDEQVESGRTGEV